MFSFVMAAPQSALSTPPAPRARRIAWWAAGVVCAVHALGAWWLWRAASEGPALAPRAQEVEFFVDLLPAQPAPAVRQAAPASPPPAVAQPASEPPPAPITQPLPMTRPPPAMKSPPPRAPSAAVKPSAQAGPAAPARDFRWRGDDAAAQGAPRARGEPQVILAPKARAEPSALAKAIAQSARPPCRDAHAHLGLLAVPLLLADAVRDSGCKW